METKGKLNKRGKNHDRAGFNFLESYFDSAMVCFPDDPNKREQFWRALILMALDNKKPDVKDIDHDVFCMLLSLQRIVEDSYEKSIQYQGRNLQKEHAGRSEGNKDTKEDTEEIDTTEDVDNVEDANTGADVENEDTVEDYGNGDGSAVECCGYREVPEYYRAPAEDPDIPF